MLETLKDRVNADAPLVRRGRWVNLTFLLGIDDEDFLVTIAEGKVASTAPLGRSGTSTGAFRTIPWLRAKVAKTSPA